MLFSPYSKLHHIIEDNYPLIHQKLCIVELFPSNAYQPNYTYHIKNQKEDMHPFNYNINQPINHSIENKRNKKEGCRIYFP
jgi:hypothetical protein